MKKNLLTLGLLSLASGAFAQVPTAQASSASVVVGARNPTWQAVNQNGVLTSPNFIVDDIVTLNATTAWAVMSEAGSTTALSNSCARTSTTLGNGTEFDFQGIGGNGAYEAANISPINDLVAFAAKYGATGGGEIVRTTNGGLRWTVQTNTQTQFAPPLGFLNWVHMFDANEGVAMGDPNPAGSFEILRTTNGAATTSTWTRTTGTVPAPLTADEYALVRSFCALGNTIWAGTSHTNGAGVAQPVRIMKSVDRGINWTVAPTPLTGAISHIAFKDANVGLAMTATTTGGIQIIRTTDGGTTWTLTTPTTTNGTPFSFNLDAVEGVGFFTVGRDKVGGTATSSEFGISFSSDGLAWTDLERGVVNRPVNGSGAYRQIYADVDFIRRGTQVNAVDGYLGGFTSSEPGALADSLGKGGFYRAVNSTGVLSARSESNAKVQSALSVFPNPSANGIFQLQLAEGIKAGTQVSVVDVLGREVLRRQLSATTVASKIANIDLSKEKAGVYTLKLTTSEGTAAQKLVIE